MTRVEILKKQLDRAYYDLSSYSVNYLCTRPKEGYEEDFRAVKETIRLIEEWIKEISEPETAAYKLNAYEATLLMLKTTAGAMSRMDLTEHGKGSLERAEDTIKWLNGEFPGEDAE